MIPLLLVMGVSALAGSALGKASAKKDLERPLYAAVLTRRGGARETVPGTLFTAWAGALEREMVLRASGDPVVSIVLLAPDQKILRTWP